MDNTYLGQQLLLGFHKALFLDLFFSYFQKCLSPDITLGLYVDDCKASRIIDDALDHASFQRDHDNRWNWSQLNNMDFNIKKCKLMRISRTKQILETTPFM